LRKKFNLDVIDFEKRGLALAIHGASGVGKTFLGGDFLRWAKAQNKGPVGCLNISGEDHTDCLAGMGLGEIAETVETIVDTDEALKDYAKASYFALVVDSLPAFWRLVVVDVVGELRYPDASKDGDKSRMYWGQIQMKTMSRVLASRKAAKYVIWLAPHDKSKDPVIKVSDDRITPDLPGKMAEGCGYWFDWVGHMTADVVNPTTVARKVNFALSNGILTRQRATRPITESINIPKDKGGWEAIHKAMLGAVGQGS